MPSLRRSRKAKSRRLAKDLNAAQRRGEDLGLTEDEIAFYDALATNDSAVQAMGDAKLKLIAAELITQVKKSVTIDWTLRESARAKIKVMVKRILNKHGYPPKHFEYFARRVPTSPLGREPMARRVVKPAMATFLGLSVLLFTLPFATVASAHDELRLEAKRDGSTIHAVLINKSARRVKVFVGYYCHSPDSAFYDSAPFSLEIDGQRRPARECAAADREAQFLNLQAGGLYEIGLALAHEEDQGVSFVVRYQPPRRFRDCWQKSLVSSAQPWPETLALSVVVTSTSRGAVELALEHKNTSADYMTVFTSDACEQPIFDTLLVDNTPQPLVMPTACRGVHPQIKSLPPGASFTTRARLQLAPGAHTLQAIYQTLRSPEWTLMLGGVPSKISYGHMTWHGTARSTGVQVDMK